MLSISVEITELDNEFKLSLLYIWIEIKEIVRIEDTSTKDTEFDINPTDLKMRKLADEFYKKFSNTLIPVKKIVQIYEKFNSVLITFQDGNGFAVPYYFYQQLKLDNPPDFTNLFNEEYSWIDLLSKIYEVTFSIRSKISSSDIKLLRTLCYYKRSGLFDNFDFLDQKNFLFQTKTLAKISNVGYRWTIQRINYLNNNFILHPLFILNPYLFGLVTYLITYDRKHEENTVFLDQITLFKLSLNFNQNLRIIQLPNTQSFYELNLEFPFSMTIMTEMHLFNNLSSLSDDPLKLYKDIPNFEAKKVDVIRPIIDFKEYNFKDINFLNFIETDNFEKHYPLLAKMSELRRNSVLIRVLNYLAQNGAVQGNLKKASKEIRVSSLEFLETCKFLFNNDIIGFFPRISRIGCNNRFGILLFDSNGSNNHILEEIYLNFLELPVSVIFKGENEIFAYVAMPDEFTV